MGFDGNPHLILIISDQTFEVTVALKFWNLNTNRSETSPVHNSQMHCFLSWHGQAFACSRNPWPTSTRETKNKQSPGDMISCVKANLPSSVYRKKMVDTI